MLPSSTGCELFLGVGRKYSFITCPTGLCETHPVSVAVEPLVNLNFLIGFGSSTRAVCLQAGSATVLLSGLLALAPAGSAQGSWHTQYLLNTIVFW